MALPASIVLLPEYDPDFLPDGTPKPQEMSSVMALVVAVGAGRVKSSAVAEVVRSVPVLQRKGLEAYSCWPTRIESEAEFMSVPEILGSMAVLPVFVIVVVELVRPESLPGEMLP